MNNRCDRSPSKRCNFLSDHLNQFSKYQMLKSSLNSKQTILYFACNMTRLCWSVRLHPGLISFKFPTSGSHSIATTGGLLVSFLRQSGFIERVVLIAGRALSTHEGTETPKKFMTRNNLRRCEIGNCERPRYFYDRFTTCSRNENVPFSITRILKTNFVIRM